MSGLKHTIDKEMCQNIAGILYMIANHTAHAESDPAKVDSCQAWIGKQAQAAGFAPLEIMLACVAMAAGYLIRCEKSAADGWQKVITEISEYEKERFGEKK